MRALFIGNSFTARNDVPGMIATLAADLGHHVEHELIWAGGASLRAHWNKGDAAARIKAGKWDWVVLQEQSTLPVKNAARMHENVRLFDEVIRAAGARTALYLTWARAATPAAQDAITDAYTSIGTELGATVVPVGMIWQHVLATTHAPTLHDADGSHPSLAGSYLAACVFVTTLLGADPSDAEFTPAALDPLMAKALQVESYAFTPSIRAASAS